MFQLRTCVTTRTTEMQPEILGEISVKVFIQIVWFGVLAHPLIRKMFCSALYCHIVYCSWDAEKNNWKICSEREDQTCTSLITEPVFGCFNVARFEIINRACLKINFIPRNRFAPPFLIAFTHGYFVMFGCECLFLRVFERNNTASRNWKHRNNFFCYPSPFHITRKPYSLLRTHACLNSKRQTKISLRKKCFNILRLLNE